ncbi:MAG: DUF4329 domain-containing protein [Pseudomonadota bacterium]
MRALSLVALMALIGCEPPLPDEIGPEFDAQAIAFLNDLQPRSIREKREYCGFFGIRADGSFRATPAVAGTLDSCELPLQPLYFTAVASYHTHAAFDEEADSEVPSTDDVRGDVQDQLYGYISTPGGRVWLVDWRTSSASQLCGIGCVFQDPAFIAGDAGPIEDSYTLRELERRER